MTALINVTLANAAAGTWTANGRTVATGVVIPANQDMWEVAEALEPAIRAHFGTEADAMVQCRVPGLVDPFSGQSAEPDSEEEVVCQFRIIDGNVEAQV